MYLSSTQSAFWRARPGSSPAILLVLLLHVLLWLAVRPGWQTHENTSNAAMQLSWIRLPEAVAPVPVPAPPAADKPKPPERSSRRPAAPAAITVVPIDTPNNAEAPAANSQQADSKLPDDPFAEAPANPEHRLNLDQLRSGVGKLARQDGMARLQASHQQRDETLEARLGEKVKKAEKKDCRKAYSGLGLLAVIPLAYSAVADAGCKW